MSPNLTFRPGLLESMAYSLKNSPISASKEEKGQAGEDEKNVLPSYFYFCGTNSVISDNHLLSANALREGSLSKEALFFFFHNKDIKYIYIVIVNNTIDMLKPFSEEFLASCKRGFTFEIIADQIKTKYEILTQEGE